MTYDAGNHQMFLIIELTGSFYFFSPEIRVFSLPIRIEGFNSGFIQYSNDSISFWSKTTHPEEELIVLPSLK